MPGYNFLPAPVWLITALHVLTLTLHFLAMNFLLGGIIIILWGRIGDRWNNPIVKKFIRLFPTIMAVTVTLGVAPLLFLQLVFHRQVYAASIVSGWFWLMIVAAVIASYYLLYATSFSQKASASTKRWFLVLTLVGLSYVAFVYSSVFSMTERPDLYTALYAGVQSGTIINPNLGDYGLRWLHMIVGAATVGGFFVGLLGKDDASAFKIGKQFFLWGTIANAVLGFAYLLTLGDILRPFMRSAGIWVLTAGIVLAFVSLHFFFRRRFVISGGMVLVTMLMMVLSRHYVRLLNLAPHYDPATMPIQPQWSVFALFLVCFLAALAVVWYMLRLYFRGKRVPA